jgi:tetratricopeptide (TPR) repeat protein
VNDSNPTYYFNRAKCFKLKKMFKEQYEDTLRAIELDDNYIKAYMVNGEALIEMGKAEQSTEKIDKGIGRLRKALGMCMKQGQRQFEREIEVQIKKANKIRWYKENEIGQIDKVQLLSQLHTKLSDSPTEETNDVFNRFAMYLN